MKHTKTLMLAALMAGSLLAGNIAMQAQDSTNATPATPVTPTPGNGAMRQRGMNIDSIATQLKLTDDQKTQVKAALDDMMKQMRALRADTSLDQDARRAKIKDLRTDLNTKVKGILTPDQYTQWQKIGPGNRRGPGAPPNSPGLPAAPTAPAAPAPAPTTPPPQ